MENINSDKCSDVSYTTYPTFMIGLLWAWPYRSKLNEACLREMKEGYFWKIKV